MVGVKHPPRVDRVYRTLEDRIRGIPPSEPLPTMPELRRELEVSQLTLERAYETLASRGLIERRKGKGVFVADRLRTGEFAIVARPMILWAQNPAPFFRTTIGHLISALQTENPDWHRA